MPNLEPKPEKIEKDLHRFKQVAEYTGTVREKVSLRGALKGAKFSVKEIDEAKRSISSTSAAK